MRTLTQLRKRILTNESGIALVSVIAIGALLSMLVVAGVAYSVGGMTKARSDQQWNGALAAAYAGVEEYQSILSNNAAYVRYGNAASSFTTPPAPAAKSTVNAPLVANPAFGLGKAGTWATVAGSAGAAQFRYEVDNSEYDAKGTVRIRSTGRVGNETRTVIANLKQKGFVEYVYFSDFETPDPYSDTSSCNRYKWASRPSNCEDITFGRGDVIDGPAHSNDTMLICDATFNERVTTESKVVSGGRYYRLGGSCKPTFKRGAPVPAAHIEMPPTNSQLKKETRYDLTDSDVPSPGCLYTGPTAIEFLSNGKMNVRSPWTLKTQVAGEPAASGRVAPECGAIADLRSSAGATVNVPANNVIFVQNVPSERMGVGAVQDPNYSASVAGVSCTFATNGNGVGYPVKNEKVASTAYGCRNGDVFVEGVVNGKVTLTAENFVYVVGDLTYQNKSDTPDGDVLGLVGQNAVYVWNPINSSGKCLDSYCNNGRTINAAILSVAHTFMVQNYNQLGNRGSLTVLGSIAQKYRGLVGTLSGSGYKKAYSYDTRFRTTAPPKFLSPLSATYGVTTWIEINPVFDRTGAYRS